jgi:hypothetical protein
MVMPAAPAHVRSGEKLTRWINTVQRARLAICACDRIEADGSTDRPVSATT